MKQIWYPLIFLVLIIPTFSLMVRSGIYSMHDPHIFRIKEFDLGFKDGIFPVRWAPDSGKGFGEPLFNFYTQFPYWLTESLIISGFGILDSAKIIYGLSLIASGFTMFILGRKYWGNRGGLVSALLYVYAPYRAVDVWVRGALPEALAFIFYPLIIYFLDLYFEKGQYKYIIGLAVSLALLITTHNLSFVMLVPFLVVYVFFRLFTTRNFKSLPGLLISGWITFGLTAYYLLPILYERGLVTLNETIRGYYDFHIHFTTLHELFISRFWGYGASLWAQKFLSVSIGQIQWILPTTLLIYMVIRKKLNHHFVLFFIFGIGALFLTHGKSSYIWNHIDFMKYIQFPWRYLTIGVFFLSLATGYIVKLINHKIIIICIILICILTNYSFFRPDIWRNISDKDNFSGSLWDEGRSSSLTDFWPIYSQKPPNAFAFDVAQFTGGTGYTINHQKKTAQATYLIEVTSNVAFLNLPITYFPGWTVTIDSLPTKIVPSSEFGLIHLQVPMGTHLISAQFLDTKPRSCGNLISFITLLTLPLWLLIKRTG